MNFIYVERKEFLNSDFKKVPLLKGEYEDCTFKECDFSEADLSEFTFLNCVFLNCNLTLANIFNTTFNQLLFKGCKLLGLRFDTCNKLVFSVRFENCILDHAVFYKLKLPNTLFKDSQLHEADFTESNLSKAVFDHCDLSRSLFMNSLLERTDFTTSFGFSIDPEHNHMKKAKFSIEGLPGLLEKYNLEIKVRD